jgi:non-specific serine/threonine protein kinase
MILLLSLRIVRQFYFITWLGRRLSGSFCFAMSEIRVLERPVLSYIPTASAYNVRCMKSSGTEHRTQGSLRTNVPLTLSSFVGRQRELAELAELLASARLVTLTGPGGCGKTRLAQQCASTIAGRFADGVYWMELGGLGDPALVPSAVAKAMNTAEQPGKTLAVRLLDHVQQKQLLLVLDNCEHLARACAQVVELLAQAPGVAVLATSRQPLEVPGERRYPVSPLLLPPASATPPELERFEAVQLFADRVRANLPHFAVTADNARVIARICRRLDGLPLAIELAGARVNVLTLEQIEARLADRFALLASSSDSVEARHRSLRAALDWSYEALSLEEQGVLQRLSLFMDGCNLETAEATCAIGVAAGNRLLDVLSALVNKSLVIAETQQAGEARFRMLETIREYVGTQHRASEDWPAALDRYLQYFVARAEQIAPQLNGQNQPAWLGWLEREHNNIRAALAWSVGYHRVEAGLRLANALVGFWLIRNYLVESNLWFERLLAQANEGLPLTLLVKAHTAAAFVAGRLGDAASAQAHAQLAVDRGEAAGESAKPALAEALAGLVMATQAAGDFQATYQIVEQIVPLHRELGDGHLLSMVLRVGGVAATALGHFESARELLTEALKLARDARDPYRTALALTYLGDLDRCERDFVAARLAYDESVILLREVGAVRDMAGSLHSLGHACLRLGDAERALSLFRESLLAQQSLENVPGIAECLVGFAALAVGAGLPGAAARLLAAGEAARQPSPTVWPAEQMEYEYYVALIRAELPEPELQVEAARGRALSVPEAIEYALGLPLRPTRIIARKADDLTEREREITALIARGRSNGEIAEMLVLSKRTVEKHVANILSKLGLTNRAQIVRWALENGLT